MSTVLDILREVTAVRVFISSDWSVDNHVAEIITRLKSHADVDVDQSPLNPNLGHDPRWHDWYGDGGFAAISTVDAFVAVVTPGYDCSTWMAHEFYVELKQYREHGRPRLFVMKSTSQRLPLGFKRYEDASTILVGTPEATVPGLLAHFQEVDPKVR